MTDGPGDSDAAARPRMRLPRVRFGVRAMLVLVAACALAMLVYREVKDGLPPRFVIRSVPGRIARLRPGMRRAEVREILGVGCPWHRGGTGASMRNAFGAWPALIEDYRMRPRGFAAESSAPFGMGPLAAGTIRLHFRSEKAWIAGKDGLGRQDDRLVGARYADDAGAVAEMSGSNRGGYDPVYID